MDMGFVFDLNGNIETPDEAYERAIKYYEYRKNRLIDKACEWMRNTLYIHTEINEDKDWGETNTTDWVTSDYDTVEDFINGFIKAIENRYEYKDIYQDHRE